MGQATGQWSAVQNLPYIPIHVAMLADGRVLFYSYYADSVHPQIWDLGTGTAVPPAAAPYQLFCSGHNQLPDGRVFITGGHIADYTGYAHSVIYDPNTNAFTTVPDMNAGRWYPTNTVLPNGDVLVVSGDQTSNTSPNPLPQIFQLGTNTWRDLTTAQLQMPLYPVMLVAPNGKVFNAGPSRTTRYLDTSGTGTWSSVGTMQSSVSRTYGPGVMYESGKVLEIGGGDPPMATVEVIDLSSSTPAWRFSGSMHYPRRQHNAVVLPDGKVLVVGGSSGSGFDNSSTPVYPTELWDPATGQWTVMANISKYRGYHSTTFLLPDGRVFSGGGNVGGPNYQLFSPPYLSAGTRPTITSALTTVGYGQTVSVGTPDAAKISKVSLIRLPSVTHTIDMNGRYMTLAFSAASGALNITIPANANLAPPGHYMLFILDGNGVPSVARIVAVGTGPSTTRLRVVSAASSGDDLKWISGYISTKEAHSPPLWWHQDWWCWDHAVSFERNPTQVAVLCYLAETNIKNGALRVLPGTHLQSAAIHAVLPEVHASADTLEPGHAALSDQHDQVTFSVKAGDAVIMDYGLLHGTHPNESDVRRDCVILNFAPSWRSLPIDIKGHLICHTALPSENETVPASSSIAKLLPVFEGERRSLPLNRNAPTKFRI